MILLVWTWTDSLWSIDHSIDAWSLWYWGSLVIFAVPRGFAPLITECHCLTRSYCHLKQGIDHHAVTTLCYWGYVFWECLNSSRVWQTVEGRESSCTSFLRKKNPLDALMSHQIRVKFSPDELSIWKLLLHSLLLDISATVVRLSLTLSSVSIICMVAKDISFQNSLTFSW